MLTFFTFHAAFHPLNLFSTWNRVSENIINALNVVNFAHLCPQYSVAYDESSEKSINGFAPDEENILRCYKDGLGGVVG